MGSCWDDWRQADSQWLRSDAADIHRQKVMRVILEEFAQEGPIVLKDPRICRFVPFVASILDELGFEHVAILPIRNPLEVTYSLRRREKFELSKSFLLWLRHVLDAEYNSRTMPRYFLPYEGLLTDWRHQLQRAANRTGIVWPDRSQAAAAAIDQFLSPDLRHDQASVRELEDHALKLPLVMETYTALRRLIEDEGDTAARRKLDGARRRFDKACQRAGAAASPDQIVAVLSPSGSLVPDVVSNMRRWLARRRPQCPS